MAVWRTRKWHLPFQKTWQPSFCAAFPARDRSRYVTEALSAKLRERDERLIQDCELANRGADVLAVEQKFDALADRTDRIAEPWDDALAR